jgi:hypothetical protein
MKKLNKACPYYRYIEAKETLKKFGFKSFHYCSYYQINEIDDCTSCKTPKKYDGLEWWKDKK